MAANTENHRHPDDQDPVEIANDMLRTNSENRTISPSADDMEGASGAHAPTESLDGQLGPDEISEPDEVVKNNEAKQHH